VRQGHHSVFTIPLQQRGSCNSQEVDQGRRAWPVETEKLTAIPPALLQGMQFSKRTTGVSAAHESGDSAVSDTAWPLTVLIVLFWRSLSKRRCWRRRPRYTDSLPDLRSYGLSSYSSSGTRLSQTSLATRVRTAGGYPITVSAVCERWGRLDVARYGESSGPHATCLIRTPGATVLT
jgi:hypothetical protein